MTPSNGHSETQHIIYAVLDSNILLHFKFVTKIDWPAVLGAKQVCLVLSPILFRELDDVKDGMTKPGRRDLAQRVLKALGDPLEAAPLDHAVPLPEQPNTTILYASEDDLAIDTALRTDKQDDYLIAATLHFVKGHPDDAVILVSNDLNCRQRAKRFGIVTRTLPEGLRRPLPRTEEEERLRRLEALEPQVRIDFGAEDGLLLLPYSARKTALDTLWAGYAIKIKEVIEALEKDYKDHVAFGRQHGYHTNIADQRTHRNPFGKEDIGYYIPRDQQLIRTLRELELSVTEDLLHPNARVVDYYTGQPTAATRPHFERWTKNVETLYNLAYKREEPLFIARQALEYYDFPVILTHTGGVGVEDGQVTVYTAEPFKFLTNKPLPPERARYNYQAHRTQWLSTPETPSEATETPFKKTFRFNSLHPGKAITCDPLYVFVESPSDVAKRKLESPLTVEVSGLNVRTPIRKSILVKLG